MIVAMIDVRPNGPHAKEIPHIVVSGQNTHPRIKLNQTPYRTQKFQVVRALVETVPPDDECGLSTKFGQAEIHHAWPGTTHPARCDQ